jgi:hypothetical protein
MLVLLGLVLVAVVLGTWRYRTAGDTVPEDWLPLQINADCDSAQAACVARGEGFAVELSLGPSVRPMQPFNIQLRVLQGQLSSAAKVELQFQMQDMDMGQNRYRLQPDKQGIWRGNAVLPVCSRGRSDWFAQIDIQDADRRWSAEMPFTVVAQ